MNRSWLSETAFAAAVTAFRLLDRSFKTQINRKLMIEILAEPDTARITEEDRATGAKIRDYYSKRGLVKILGANNNDWDQKLIAASSSESIDFRDLGLVAFTPESYRRDLRREIAESRIQWADQTIDWEPESVITFRGEVVRSIYSTKWQQYYVTVLTDTNKLVLFPTRKIFALGDQIQCTGTMRDVVDGNVARIRRPSTALVQDAPVPSYSVEV